MTMSICLQWHLNDWIKIRKVTSTTVRWQRKDFCVVFLPCNRTHHYSGTVCNSVSPFLPSDWCTARPQGTPSVCVAGIRASSTVVCDPLWGRSWMWGGKKGDDKMVLNSEHSELTKNQKQWTWGVSDGGSLVVSHGFNAALTPENTHAHCTLWMSPPPPHSTGKHCLTEPESQCSCCMDKGFCSHGNKII